jgi:hypothetical protein
MMGIAAPVEPLEGARARPYHSPGELSKVAADRPPGLAWKLGSASDADPAPSRRPPLLVGPSLG